MVAMNPVEDIRQGDSRAIYSYHHYLFNYCGKRFKNVRLHKTLSFGSFLAYTCGQGQNWTKWKKSKC